MQSQKEIFLKKFGANVRNLRISKKMTQFDLACKINKDRQSIQRIESGNVNPTIYYLKELSDGLEVDMIKLFSFLRNKSKK